MTEERDARRMFASREKFERAGLPYPRPPEDPPAPDPVGRLWRRDRESGAAWRAVPWPPKIGT